MSDLKQNLAYTVSPFINISGLSLIKLVRIQESKSFIVNWQEPNENQLTYRNKSTKKTKSAAYFIILFGLNKSWNLPFLLRFAVLHWHYESLQSCKEALILRYIKKIWFQAKNKNANMIWLKLTRHKVEMDHHKSTK